MIRHTGRVIPLDEHDRALLMHGIEPRRPDQPFWFTIGGGVEEGETERQAAARELFEETGIVVDEAELGEAVIVETVEFDWNGIHIVQEQTIFTCRLPGSTVVNLDGLEEGEIGSVYGGAWVELTELERVGQQIEGACVADYVRACQAALA